MEQTTIASGLVRCPSSKGAREMAEFVARWNLGGASVDRVSEVRAVESGWTWQFELVGATSPMEIALWPVTWASESRIREVRMEGGLPVAAAVPNVRVEASDPPVVVWSRPGDKQGVQRFQVEWKQD